MGDEALIPLLRIVCLAVIAAGLVLMRVEPEKRESHEGLVWQASGILLIITAVADALSLLGGSAGIAVALIAGLGGVAMFVHGVIIERRGVSKRSLEWLQANPFIGWLAWASMTGIAIVVLNWLIGIVTPTNPLVVLAAVVLIRLPGLWMLILATMNWARKRRSPAASIEN